MPAFLYQTYRNKTLLILEPSALYQATLSHQACFFIVEVSGEPTDSSSTSLTHTTGDGEGMDVDPHPPTVSSTLNQQEVESAASAAASAHEELRSLPIFTFSGSNPTSSDQENTSGSENMEVQSTSSLEEPESTAVAQAPALVAHVRVSADSSSRLAKLLIQFFG